MTSAECGDAYEMVARCGRRQHPEFHGGEVIPAPVLPADLSGRDEWMPDDPTDDDYLPEEATAVEGVKLLDGHDVGAKSLEPL